MRRHNVTLSEPVSSTVQAQVKSGRYKDFSAAVQDALWNFFLGTPSPYEEYALTPEELDRAYERDLAEVSKRFARTKLSALSTTISRFAVAG